jgi:hypothetical protein
MAATGGATTVSDDISTMTENARHSYYYMPMPTINEASRTMQSYAIMGAFMTTSMREPMGKAGKQTAKAITNLYSTMTI